MKYNVQECNMCTKVVQESEKVSVAVFLMAGLKSTIPVLELA